MSHPQFNATSQLHSIDDVQAGFHTVRVSFARFHFILQDFIVKPQQQVPRKFKHENKKMNNSENW